MKKNRDVFVETVERKIANGSGLEPLEIYPFLRYFTATLLNEKRWQKYAEKNRNLGISITGQQIQETALEHLFDKMWIGAEMVALEKQRGKTGGIEINTSRLFLGFAVYSFGIALRGERSLMEMSLSELEKEDEDFEKLLSLYPDNSVHERVHSYIRSAYYTSREWERAVLQGLDKKHVSVTGKFLWAVIVLSFLYKSLYEVSEGRISFVNTFHNIWSDIMYLQRVFNSFKLKVDPMLSLISEYMDNFPRWKE